jgi:HD domain
MSEQPPQLALLTEPWARAAVRLVRAEEPESIANHSIRSFIFARLLGEHLGMSSEVEERLLFAATILHDIGLRTGCVSANRFEIDGADRAAEFLQTQQFSSTEIEVVWEAIALHTSPGIAERRGPIALLTRAGVGIDFGRGSEFIDDGLAGSIHRRWPRLAMVTSLVDAIVAQCQANPEKGPRYSIAGELTRERSCPPHETSMEAAAVTSRWGRT